jgi:hypothetical protein
MTSSTNLNDIENSLPNGFHDALLEGVSIDFVSKKAKLDLKMSIGNPDAETREGREAYKKAELHFHDLLYFVIDPPENLEFFNGKDLRIDAGDATDERNSRSPKPLIALPKNAFAYWFFIVEANSFIHIAAMSASLRWAVKNIE